MQASSADDHARARRRALDQLLPGARWLKARWALWTRFDADAIDRDLAGMAWLRANTVRVIVPAGVSATRSPKR